MDVHEFMLVLAGMTAAEKRKLLAAVRAQTCAAEVQAPHLVFPDRPALPQ